MKNKLILIFGLVAFLANAQSTDKNFTMSIVPKKAMNNSELNSAHDSLVLKNITYYDGIGRPIQSNAIGQTPGGKDIIQHYEYDQFGRKEKTYLPLPANQNNGNFVTNPVLQIENYYENLYGDNNPYYQERFDNTLMNRVVESSKPGNDWRMSSGTAVGVYASPSITINSPSSSRDYNATESITLTSGAHLTGDVHLKIIEEHFGHTTRFNYLTNSKFEVKRFDVRNDGSIFTTYYTEDELQKRIVLNENWKGNGEKLNTTEVFTDKNGRTVCEIGYRMYDGSVEKLYTYHIYDDLGRLIYTIPPKCAVREFGEVDSNRNFYWNYTKFLSPYFPGGGGGSASASIQNGILKISGGAGFNSYNLKTGKIAFIHEDLPDMDLGNIVPDVGESGNYKAYLKDGFLCVRFNTYPASVTRLSFSFEIPVGNLSITTEQEFLDALAFQYKYDQYNRQIAQKTPGKGWEYVVYDQLDNPILVQDANLKKDGLWLFTKFDTFGRTVYSGKYSSTKTRTQLQTEVDNFINTSTNKANVEKRTANTTSIGGVAINYSNDAFPKTNIAEVLVINYFDNYDFTDIDKPTTPTLIEGQTVTTKTRGFSTSSWSKTLDSNTWSKTYTYYDQKGRSIKTYEKNHLGGYTTTDSKLDFRGRVEKAITKHKRNSSSSLLTISDRYEYDHADRLTSQYQKINTQPEEHLVSHEYNELGYLILKNTGGSSSNNTLQNTSYGYNILGWTKEVNNVDNIGSDLFAFKLNYNEGSEGEAIVPKLYNGNIAQTIWKSKFDDLKKSYSYQYNSLNQITDGYFRFNESLNGQTNGKFELHNVDYDMNGNITSLQRNGTTGQIDNLLYKYGTNYGNQLTEINDGSDKNTGFIDGNSSGDDYLYDDNGNLIKDLNKNISSIEYNHLDLVKKVTFNNGRNIQFTYDASGRKLFKTYINGGITTQTDYLGGFQYQQSQLQFFPTDGGYVYKDTSTNNFKYVYIFPDHLGNNRVTYGDTNGDGTISTNEILSNTDYYPMGLIHSGEFNSSIASNFNYKFQGKELQTDNNITLYDFGSRMYDPTVGRWFNTDPQNQFGSPYLAMGNNPITSIDPNGEIAIGIIGIIAATAIGGGYSAITTANNGGNFFDALGAFTRGATVSGFSATVGAATGGAVAATGTPYFGTLAAVTSSVSSTATSNFISGNNITDGLISGAVGSAVGAYIGGGSGAFTGGAISGGLEKAIDGGNFGEVLGAAGTSGALSLISYEIMEEIAYQNYQNGPREFGNLTRRGYQKFSRAGQRSFARNRESGGYFLSDGNVGKIAWGGSHGVTLPERPANSLARFHFHPSRRAAPYPSLLNGEPSDISNLQDGYVISSNGEAYFASAVDKVRIANKYRTGEGRYDFNQDAYSGSFLSYKQKLQYNITHIPAELESFYHNIHRPITIHKPWERKYY